MFNTHNSFVRDLAEQLLDSGKNEHEISLGERENEILACALLETIAQLDSNPMMIMIF